MAPANWTHLPTPEPKGILALLQARLRAYDVNTDRTFLAKTDHGMDINPGAPEIADSDRLRGPFQTVLFIDITVPCIKTGESRPFPFKFGHPDRLRRAELESWVLECVINMLRHEAHEALVLSRPDWSILTSG